MKKKRRKKIRFTTLKNYDFTLMITTIIMLLFGVVMVFSASYYFSINTYQSPYYILIRELKWGILGFAALLICSRLDYHIYKKLAPYILLIIIALLIIVLTPIGTVRNGARRWISLGVITIMPGEIAKGGMLIYVSAYFSSNLDRVKKWQSLLFIVLVTLLCCLLILKEPNLSTAFTLLFIVFGILFLAGLSYKVVFSLIALSPIGIFVLFKFAKGYQIGRMKIFLNPFVDAKGKGYQVVQSLLAIGSGGITGKGLGQSLQKTLYLPEPHTDFIMAVVGEELGLIGIMVMTFGFLILVWRCFRIAINAKDSLGMLLAGGVGIMIGLQVIFNLGIVTSTLPPTGVAMPFISYGGNALLIVMALIGIVLNISRHEKERKDII